MEAVEEAGKQLTDGLVRVAAIGGTLVDAADIATSLPVRDQDVLEVARRVNAEREADDSSRREVRRLLDLLAATGLFGHR